MFRRISYPLGVLGVVSAIDEERNIELSVVQAAPDNQIKFKMTISGKRFPLYGEYKGTSPDSINWKMLKPSKELLLALEKISRDDPYAIIEEAIKTYSAPMRKPVPQTSVQFYGGDLEI